MSDECTCTMFAGSTGNGLDCPTHTLRVTDEPIHGMTGSVYTYPGQFTITKSEWQPYFARLHADDVELIARRVIELMKESQ